MQELTNEELTRELLIALHEGTENSPYARECQAELSSRLNK